MTSEGSAEGVAQPGVSPTETIEKGREAHTLLLRIKLST